MSSKQLFAVSFCLVSFCLISFCFIGFCLVSFCLVSLCFIRFCLVSLCLISLCFIGILGSVEGVSVGRAFFSGFSFSGLLFFFFTRFFGDFSGLFSNFFGTLSHPPPSLIIIKIHSRLPREGSIYPHFVHSITAFCPHLFCHIDPPNVPNVEQKHTPNVP